MADIDCNIPVYDDASWKGIPFVVLSSNDEFGRRGHQYEYPLSEQTGYKDLGRRIRQFSISGYLIGADQIEKSNRMARAAESPEPGTLSHPMFGPMRVACVTLKISAEYKKEIRRTKLDFNFVEANDSMAPYNMGQSHDHLYASGTNAIDTAVALLPWAPTSTALNTATAINSNLAQYVVPAVDEDSFDVVSMLQGQRGGALSLPSFAPQLFGVAPASIVAYGESEIRAGYLKFEGVITPISRGTAEVRRLHEDASKRLRAFNAFVVEQSTAEPSVESLIVGARLSLIRDYALAVQQHHYDTVSEALLDLDFVMAVYDDEERMATERCYDVLVTAIRQARDDAARLILQQNVQLPGIMTQPVHGIRQTQMVWDKT